MTILYGTLGFTPEKLLPSTRNHAVRKLVAYHDHHEESRRAAEVVRKFCEGRGVEFVSRPQDAFDIIECAAAMRRDIRRDGRDEIVFNVTGGTPVISSAATLACILEGVRAVYVDSRSGTERALPLLTLRYTEILNAKQRRVLRFVANRGPAGASQVDVAEGLSLAPATVSYHVGKLKERQLLSTARDPDDARREMLRVMESAALLLLDDLGDGS